MNNTIDFAALVGEDIRGCVRVENVDGVIFERAYGMADLPNSRPNTAETRFATASAGKAFVAVAIMQLIEEGRLSMDATIGELFKFDLHDVDPEVTVRQLLNHTSGVPDYFDESVMEEYDELWRDYPNYKIRTSADILPLMLDKPMMYPRGERFQYNNSGYVLLGLVIETVTGAPFDAYLRERVFEPAGMTRTGYYELDRLPEGCANGYIEDGKGGYYTNIYSVDVKGTGAGGAFTTMGDVSRFWRALLGGKLVSPGTVEAMTHEQAAESDEDNDRYGYGFWVRRRVDKESQPFFQGCDPGVCFISNYYPEHDMIVSVVSNYGDNVWDVWWRIHEKL